MGRGGGKPDKGGGGGGGKKDKPPKGGGGGGGGGSDPSDPQGPIAAVTDAGVSRRPEGRGGVGSAVGRKKGLSGAKRRDPLGLVPRGSGFGKSLLGE